MIMINNDTYYNGDDNDDDGDGLPDEADDDDDGDGVPDHLESKYPLYKRRGKKFQDSSFYINLLSNYQS